MLGSGREEGTAGKALEGKGRAQLGKGETELEGERLSPAVWGCGVG